MASGIALLCGAATGGCVSAGAPHAASVEDKTLAAWQQKMVRPCARSGGRLIC